MGMRSGSVRLASSLTSFLLGGLSLYGLATNPAAVTAQNRLNKPIQRQGRYKLGGRIRSRYWPHQGAREIARRKRQIDEGKLQITGESDAMRSIRLAMNDVKKVQEAA